MVLKCNFRQNCEQVRALPLALHKIPEYTALADYCNWAILSFIARPLRRVKALKSCEWGYWWIPRYLFNGSCSHVDLTFPQFPFKKSGSTHLLTDEPEFISNGCKSSTALCRLWRLPEPVLEMWDSSLTGGEWLPKLLWSTHHEQTSLPDTTSPRQIYRGPIQEAANLDSFLKPRSSQVWTVFIAKSASLGCASETDWRFATTTTGLTGKQ